MAWLVYSHRGVAKRLVLDIEPAGARAGVAFDTQPVGHLVDGSGLPSRAAGVTVTASKTAGSGALGGTLTALTDDEGVFAFSDLAMSAVAGGVTLQFASGVLVAVECASFNVTASGYVLAGDAASYAWSGSAVTLGYGRRLTAGLAAYAWSPAAATLRSGRRLTATTRAYAWTGGAATLTYSAGAAFTDDGFYIATHEAVNANTLLAEDFSRGAWYVKNCDVANASGGLGQTGVHGWCGTIYADSLLSANPGAVVSLGGSEYAATTGFRNFVGGGNMADHALLGGVGVDEIYVRFYTKPLAGYSFGAEKVLTFNDGGAGGGGIKWGNFSWNCAGGPDPTGTLTMGFPVPEDVCSHMTPNYSLIDGHWYYIELHMKLNTLVGTANGQFHCWADDCGTGTLPVNPVGSPTLRLARTNVNYARNSSSELIRVLWLEAWANPPTTGTRYWRSVYASKAFIGFAPAGITGGTA